MDDEKLMAPAESLPGPWESEGVMAAQAKRLWGLEADLDEARKLFREVLAERDELRAKVVELRMTLKDHETMRECMVAAADEAKALTIERDELREFRSSVIQMVAEGSPEYGLSDESSNLDVLSCVVHAAMCAHEWDALHAGRDELLARAESAELGCEIAYQREPTQADGDAHEHSAPAHRTGECFVPMGGWTGRRCRICRRWVWGGPTACVACVERELRAKLEKERDELRAKVEADKAAAQCMRDALTKIDTIRNSIIGRQSVNWSMHVYPLVEVLRNVGLDGEGYEMARKKAEAEHAVVAAVVKERDDLRAIVERVREKVASYDALDDGVRMLWGGLVLAQIADILPPKETT